MKKEVAASTEKDYQKAVDTANQYVIAGFFIPIIGLLAIQEVPRNIRIARNSQNPKILKKAKQVMNAATALFFLWVIWPAVLISSVLNLYVGILISILSLAGFYIYGKKHSWSRLKIISYLVLTILVAIYSGYSYFYNKEHNNLAVSTLPTILFLS